MNRTFSRLSIAVLAAIAAAVVLAAEPSPPMDMHQKHMMMMQGSDAAHSGDAHSSGAHGGDSAPSMPAQDAFGTIQEIVRILEADPATDWSKVDLEALRRHLIDMNEVTSNAGAVSKAADNGIEITVTGTGRTIGSIQRIVGAHAREIDGMNGWSARAEIIDKGARLTVTSIDMKEVRHIRGLGFIGLLVEGSHHQHHHLAIARRGDPRALEHGSENV